MYEMVSFHATYMRAPPPSLMLVGELNRAFARGSTLAVFVFFILLMPYMSTEVALASGSGTRGPLSTGGTARLVVDPDDAYAGFTLIAPYNQFNMFLVDPDKSTVHTWRTDRRTKGAAELLQDGTVLRGCAGPMSSSPDCVQRLDWNGTVLWEFELPEPYMWHHDLEPMLNGNVLVNAVVIHPKTKGLDLGRDPSFNPETLRVEPILEIRPNGTFGGDVVWKWDPLDHLIQDYSPDRPNYGVVRDHPELIDFNYPGVNMTEWQHSNSVEYNADLDQVMVTNRNFDEIWVIDHSTTTEEAAGHSGGDQGKGGDILYRWGNPRAYDRGNASDQILFGPHDGNWIAPGLPGEGNIIIFNNGMNLYMTRPDGRISTVEEIVPPVNDTGGYELSSGSAYGPLYPTWSWAASPPSSFFAAAMGSAVRLPDGNTLISGGSSNKVFEVAANKNVVWSYTANVFKARRYFPPAHDRTMDLEATEDVMLRVDLHSLMPDPDTDAESIAFSVDSPYATIQGDELLLLYPEGVPSDLVKLTASDGIFQATWDIPVTVLQVNDPLVLVPIPDLAAVEDVVLTLDLGQYIMDPDTRIEDMLFTEDSFFASADGGVLRLLYPDGVLADSFILTVSDGEFVASADVRVSVTPVNDPPAVDRIPDQRGVEDVPWEVDLASLVRDVDSPAAALSVTSASEYARVSGWVLTLLYPEGVTRDVVRLSVSDGQATTVAAFDVFIEPVNDPPAIGDLPPVKVREDEPFTLDLGPAVTDIDTPREGLSLRVGSPFATVDGLLLTLLYPDGVLHDEVRIDVWDGELDAGATLVVDVEPVNDPPHWTAVLEIVAVEDVEGALDLEPYMDDVDTPLPSLVVEVESPYGWIDGHILRYRFPRNSSERDLTLTLSDGEHAVVLRTSANVTHPDGGPDPPVGPGKHPPMILGVSVSPAMPTVGGRVLLAIIVHDADPRVADLEAWVEVILPGGETLGNYSMEGVPATDGFTFISALDAEGEHTFVVRVVDGDGQWASRTGTVLVGPPSAQAPDGGSRPTAWWVWASLALSAVVAAGAVVAVLARGRRVERA